MTVAFPEQARQWAWPIVFAVGYFACAQIALQLTSGADGIAAVWPASGVFIAGLLLFRAERRNALILGVAVASMIANLLGGANVLEAIGYTAANIVEGLIVLWVMARLVKSDREFSDPLSIIGFVCAAIGASAVSSALAALLTHNWTQQFVSSWFTTVLLGMLAVTPAILFVAEDPERRRKLLSATSIGMFLITAAASFLAFWQSDVPLLFLPMVAVLFTTLFVGLSGTSIAAIIVATIGSIMTARGYGVVSEAFDALEDKVLFFQFYFLALLLAVLPVAVLLARHRVDLRELAESNRSLRAAERAARVGHWRYSVAKREMTWSAGARKIAGADDRAPSDLHDFVELHHEDDRDRANGAIDIALTAGLPFTYTARLHRHDGRLRNVECRTEVEFASDGDVSIIFGTLRDVTDFENPPASETVPKYKFDTVDEAGKILPSS